MSVIMTFWFMGDPEKVEQIAAENPDQMRAISDRATEHGLIAHRFYGSEGQIMIIDEWPDEESFQRFFESQQEIPKIMQEVATGEPQISFYRPLETGDEF